ncbi:hypothetical protein [Scytonema sp. NUACC26]|uniref:hypothetical protein n=1 Tax=Scytonema sp. NUACC26 TaxID=3140176 RepID=UPI0034DC243F
MSHIRSGINLNVILLLLLNFLWNRQKQQKQQTYDYTECVCGCDYAFEPVDNLTKGYMTAQFKGIKRGDYILLKNGSNLYRYQVEEIDYYSEPPDMWIALLHKVVQD